MKFNLLFSFLIIFTFFFSCSDENDQHSTTSKEPDRILIPNYGNWGSADGSLSEYSFSKDSVTRDVYSLANGTPLPKGVQSVAISGNKIFLTCLDDNLILVLDKTTYLETGRIHTGDFSGPNFLTNGTDGFLYLTFTGSGRVARLNPATFEIVNLVATDNPPSDLRVVNGKIYVVTSGYYPDFGNEIAVIGLASGKLEKRIRVGKNPFSLGVYNNTVAVFCVGDYSTVHGGIFLINSTTDAISDSIKFTSSFPYSRLALSSDGYLFFTDNGIKKVNISTGKFGSVENFSTATGHPFLTEGTPAAIFSITESSSSKLEKLQNGIVVKSHKLGIFANGTAVAIYK